MTMYGGECLREPHCRPAALFLLPSSLQKAVLCPQTLHVPACQIGMFNWAPRALAQVQMHKRSSIALSNPDNAAALGEVIWWWWACSPFPSHAHSGSGAFHPLPVACSSSIQKKCKLTWDTRHAMQQSYDS